MNDRLVTLFGALAALVLVIVLLLPPPEPPGVEVSLPTSTHSGRYGLLGLKRWLEQSGVPTLSLQTRYDQLFSEPNISASGNLLIISSPSTVPAREQELERLMFWLSQGNDVLLLRGHSDAPQWALAAPDEADGDVLNRLGFQLLEEPAAAAEEPDEDEDTTLAEQLRLIGRQMEELQYRETILTPAHPHPLTSGVNAVGARALPAAPVPTQLLGLDWPRHALTLLRDADGRPAFWETRIGQGRLWVCRFADLFGNVTLGQHDNARLLTNVVRHSLQSGGRVIFDDMHLGVSSLYDPQAFFGDSRLHNTLWFMFGFWLLYVVGHANRFAPLSDKPAKVHSVDFTYAVGGFFARRLTDHSAATALFRHFFNDVRAHYHKPLTGEPVWELIERNPRLTPKTLNRLQQQYAALDRNKRFNLVKLRNQLLTVREQILL